MKKRVEQLINGKFEYDHPALNVSEKEINLLLSEGEPHRGEFVFAAEDGSAIKGMLVSDSRRILLSEDRFQGGIIHVTYGIDTAGLKPGSEGQGKIVIMSDIGETVIPVHYTIRKGQVRSSKGTLKNLDDFAALAREDYREAFRIFTGKDFLNFSAEERKSCLGLYKGMSHNPVTYQHMEEFLIGMGKKEPVRLSLDKDRKETLKLEGSMKDTLYIYRSTWGYLRAEVETVGDFLEVDKKIITSEDFIGSVFGLEYIILRDRLGKGKRFGKIRIRTVYGQLEFEVVASAAGEYEISMHGFQSRVRRDLTRSYLDRCLQKIDGQQFKEQTDQILKELKNSGNYSAMTQLYEAWVCLENHEETQAEKLIAQLADRTFSPEESQEEAAYLYLARRTGLRQQDAMEYRERIHSLYRRNPKSLVLLYILLRDEEISHSPVKRLSLMEQQFELGVTSPVLYLEACQVIREDENQFRKLTPFMIQVLAFAGRNRLLTKELGMRAAYLASHEKTFKSSVYRILCKVYENWPEKDTVEAICRLVMMGQPGKKEYFKWYALAVEMDIRITRLYEFYIETMSRHYQEPLPKAVRLYFSYQNTLSSERKAFIYARVVRNKEQDMETYRMYRDAMETFAAQSLMEGRINEDYAALYQEFVTEVRDSSQAGAYAAVMFTHRLYSDDPKVRNVIVCHGALKEEQSYPCREGVAYINIYSPDARILFEDAKHRRYVATVDYNLQKLLEEKEPARQCMAFNIPDPGLLLYICGSNPERTSVTVRNMGCFQLTAESDAFEEEYRCKVRRKLLDYYDKNAGDDTLNEYLGRLDYEEFYKVDYLLLQDILIRHGFCREAFELIQKYGYEGIDTADLFKLCRRLILDTDFAENEELLYLAYYVMEQGKYDEVLLGYLRDGYMGPVDHMVLIWERLKGFQMDGYMLEEEILLLSMYTRVNFPKLAKVLESYVKNRGKEVVIAAAFTYLAYGYFLDDIRIDMFVFKSLERLYEEGQDMDLMCWLALLKRYRFSKKLNSYQKDNVRGILKRCRDEKLRFAFFKELPPELIRGYQLEDKVFVEKRFSPAAHVILHYAILRKDEEPVYKSEPLKNGFHGVFAREFLLFYGERLKYYLTVEEGEKTFSTEEEKVMLESISAGGTTRYDMINQMLAYHEMGNDPECRKIMKKYRQMERLTEELFQMAE
ncbi:MAG: DUF5717 family protein [Ruminococcus sp.]|jgi:hypothetical protein